MHVAKAGQTFGFMSASTLTLNRFVMVLARPANLSVLIVSCVFFLPTVTQTQISVRELPPSDVCRIRVRREFLYGMWGDPASGLSDGRLCRHGNVGTLRQAGHDRRQRVQRFVDVAALLLPRDRIDRLVRRELGKSFRSTIPGRHAARTGEERRRSPTQLGRQCSGSSAS